MSQATSLQKHLQSQHANNSSSLRQRVETLNHLATENILLLDISGSMMLSVETTDTAYSAAAKGERRIDLLWDLVQSLRAEGIEFRVCEFSSEPSWSDGYTKPSPTGSTALHRALDFISAHEQTQVTVITDGHPDSQEAAFASAARIRGKINVLYVGPPDERAEAFCRDLATGNYAANTLETKLLQASATETARLMLSAPKADTHRSSSINL